ncbi:putative membrane protein [Salibacterium halotolerans]|uniref:Putative membrane protein n=2 Tax=Salibacterium halotolerans TaxID=1884432 RepID=A0A1I5S584_9BACI|nr:putative membrane protein [Salibacterium halotolerans]
MAMSVFWESILWFVVVMAVIFIAAFLFEKVTKFKDREEIKAGNVSVALSLAGKIYALGYIMKISAENAYNLGEALAWGLIGFVLLIAGYFLFEFLTPSFKVDDELAKDNKAVGIMSLAISVVIAHAVAIAII